MIGFRERVEAERARRSLALFFRLVWPLLEPGPLVPGFHIDLICERLEAVARGETRQLLINLPPRHTKSLLVSVSFPAWLWLTRPQTRFMHASYGIDLATRDSLKTRRLVESGWYRDRYGTIFQLAGDQNEKSRFETDKGGARLATSAGGSATGQGADIIVIDDPHKIEQASSQAQREAVLEWFDQTISTRLNNPRDGAIIVIGQRVHEDDLFGHLLNQPGWEHVCLPAEYDPDHPHLSPEDPRTHPGELLAPERFGHDELARLKRQLGTYGAAAQLQQTPAPAAGGIFQRSWWQWYDPNDRLPPFDELLTSWDLSFVGTPTSDYVVGQLWGIVGGNRFLLDQIRAQLGFPETIDAFYELIERANIRYPRFAGHSILVENAANGPAVIATLQAQIPSIIPIKPTGDKVGRAHAVAPQIEAGNVYLPGFPNANRTGYDRARTPAWVQTLVEETATFPNGRHDDQVDALTQALLRAARPGARVYILA